MVGHFYQRLKADFHSVVFFDWTGNPLLMCENVAMNWNRMLRVSKILLSKIQSARKIVLSGIQPLHMLRVPSSSSKPR